MKQRYTIIFGILIGLVMLVLILSGVDLARVRDAISGADYRYLFPAVALLMIGHVTRGIRWQALLRGRLSFSNAFAILNISYLFNGVLPFRLGEVARIFLAARLPKPVAPSTTLSTIVVERLLDLLSVIGMLGIVLTMLPVPAYVTTAGLTLGIGSVVGVGGLMVFARRHDWALALLRLATRLLPWLGRFALEDAVEHFLDGLDSLSTLRSTLMALFWSVVSWGFSILAGYSLLYAFFPQPTWTATLFFIVMAALAVSVPYVPGAVGPYEAGVVLALHLTGFDRPEGAAVAFAVILHVTNVGVYTVLGLLGLVQEGVTLAQVAHGAREIKPASVPSQSAE